MIDLTSDELKLLYNLLEEYTDNKHSVYREKALEIIRKIDQHFGWDWNG